MKDQFDFGENWLAFSDKVLTEKKVNEARRDFQSLIGNYNLAGKSFLDIGFGQGLSLLIATEMGASTVGCDLNEKCNETLNKNRERFFKHLTDKKIPVIVGSILEKREIEYLKNLSPEATGTYDLVHSWGVLHHTGNMREAIRNSVQFVKPGGLFIIAIYNKHWSSPVWKIIKRIYCSSPRIAKKIMISLSYPVIFVAKFIVTGKNPKSEDRGMDFYYNIIDWIGGYPYEYASTAEIKKIVSGFGFSCTKIIPAVVPTGCNEFVFTSMNNKSTGQINNS